MPDALLIIDVQKAIMSGSSTEERRGVVVGRFDGVVRRLVDLRDMARAQNVPIFIVQNDGPEGDKLAKGTTGWEVVDALAPHGSDHLINKKSCDAFYETALLERLRELGITRLIVGGCATQYCIDTSVRSAISHGFSVTLVADGHCTGDSPTLRQEDIIAHHNQTLNGFNAGQNAVSALDAENVSYQID